MLAKDVMTTQVITVLENTPVEEVVRTLLRWRISALPVVAASGRVVGIVSEGDLMRRPESGTDKDISWWLSDLLEPEERAKRYAKVRGQLAKDVMTTSVITAHENATLGDLATLLEENRIKRVPIVRSNRLVGIVSRANLLHGFSALPESRTAGEGSIKPAPAAPGTTPVSNDEATRATILNRLHNEIGIGGAINVIVANGVVDLWGGVETEAERQAARSAAESVPHVSAVNDHLSVLPAALRNFSRQDR